MKRQYKHLEKAEPVMNITRKISVLDKQLLAVHKDIAVLKMEIDRLTDIANEGITTREGIHIPL